MIKSLCKMGEIMIHHLIVGLINQIYKNIYEKTMSLIYSSDMKKWHIIL